MDKRCLLSVRHVEMLPVNMPLVHISRVFHLFLISPIFIITETRACRHALENILPIYFILVYRVSIVKL